MQIEFEKPDTRHRRVEDIEEPEAIALLSKGVARLCDEQASPPMAFLEFLEERAEDATVFGPPVEEPNVIEKVSAALFPQGLRQRILNGAPIPWMDSSKLLFQSARIALSRCSARDRDLFEQASTVINRHMRSSCRKAAYPSRMSKSRARKMRLVKARSGSFLHGTWDYWELDADWFAYYEKNLALGDLIKSTVLRAMAEGRILFGEVNDGHGCLIHPNQSAQMNLRHPKFNFCFSSELPDALLSDPQTLHKRRYAAAAWMKRASQTFEQSGRRAGKDDLICVAATKFNLTTNAAAEAWKDANRGLSPKVGRIPAHQIVTISEINDVE